MCDFGYKGQYCNIGEDVYDITVQVMDVKLRKMTNSAKENMKVATSIDYINYLRYVITYEDMASEDSVCEAVGTVLSMLRGLMLEEREVETVLDTVDRLLMMNNVKMRRCAYDLLKYLRGKIARMYSVRGESSRSVQYNTFNMSVVCTHSNNNNITYTDRHNAICSVVIRTICEVAALDCNTYVDMHDVFVYDVAIHSESAFEVADFVHHVNDVCMVYDGNFSVECDTRSYQGYSVCMCRGIGDLYIKRYTSEASYVDSSGVESAHDVFDLRIRRKWYSTNMFVYMIVWFVVCMGVIVYGSVRDRRKDGKYRIVMIEEMYRYIHSMMKDDITFKFEKELNNKKKKDPSSVGLIDGVEDTQETVEDEEAKQEEEKVKALTKKFKNDIVKMKHNLYIERKIVYDAQDKVDSLKVDDEMMKMIMEKRIDIKDRKDMKQLREYMKDGKAREMYLKYLEDDENEEEDFGSFNFDNKNQESNDQENKIKNEKKALIKSKLSKNPLPQIIEEEKEEKDDSKEDIKDESQVATKKKEEEKEKEEPPRPPILQNKEASDPLEMLFKDHVSINFEKVIRSNPVVARELILEFDNSYLTMKESDKQKILDRFTKVRLYLLTNSLTSSFIRVDSVACTYKYRSLRMVWYLNSYTMIYSVLFYAMIDVPLYKDTGMFYSMMISSQYSAKVTSVWFLSMGITAAIQLIVTVVFNMNEKMLKMYSDIDLLKGLIKNMESKVRMYVMLVLSVFSLLVTVFMSIYLETTHGRTLVSSYLQAFYYTVLIDSIAIDWMWIITIHGMKKNDIVYPILSMIKGVYLPAHDVRILCMYS